MELETKTIILEKLDLPDNDRIRNLQEMVHQYLYTFNEAEHMDIVKGIKEDISNAYDERFKLYNKRFHIVNSLLLNYWKISKTNWRCETIPVMYIYPYKLLNSNNRLFCLCSPIKPEYNINNGLHEESFDIMDDSLFKDNTLIFEETTVDEMMENAKQSCEDALHDRLWKLKYRDNVLD